MVELAVVLVHQEVEDREEVVTVPVDPKGRTKILLHGRELSAKMRQEERNSPLYLVDHSREKKERVGPTHRPVTGEIMQLPIMPEETVGIISHPKDPFPSVVVVVDAHLKNAINLAQRLVFIFQTINIKFNFQIIIVYLGP